MKRMRSVLLAAVAHLVLVRPMRALLIVGFCLLVTGCMKKTDLGALPPLTRVVVSPSEAANELLYPPPPLDEAKASAVATFIDSQRFNWTRAIGVGFGVPNPVYYAHLYEGNRYLGYFGVGAAVLPGSSALFEVRYGKIYARKRVTTAEANRFLDLIGIGGELSVNGDDEVRQQIASRSSAPRTPGSNERPVKFRQGDSVIVKAGRVEGKVCLRTRFFQEDQYWVTVPGKFYVFFPVREREERLAQDAASYAQYGSWSEYPKPSHDEGPFYEYELEPASQ